MGHQSSNIADVHLRCQFERFAPKYAMREFGRLGPSPSRCEEWDIAVALDLVIINLVIADIQPSPFCDYNIRIESVG